MFGKYISDKGLNNLQFYKYHGVDHSIIANHIMQPFWRWAVNFLPITMAPNLVTLVGFFAIVASYLLFAFFSPSISESAPSWVYLFAAFCMFFYQTMDALDGKQARRTGNSSPLGELFDHGCDAMSTTLIGLSLACALRLGSGWYFFFVTLSSYLVFFMAQWEEFQTGTLELGVVNVTEIQLLICGFYLSCYFFGSEIWLSQVTLFGYTIPANYIPAFIILCGTVGTMANNVLAVLGPKAAHKNSKVTALIELFPITLLAVGATLWAYLSPTNISVSSPHCFFLTIGFIFSYITGRIVTHRVCQEAFGLFHPIELLLVVAVVLCQFYSGFADIEGLFLKFFLVAAIGQYLHFAYGVINQMCNKLNIRCLHIPAPDRKSVV